MPSKKSPNRLHSEVEERDRDQKHRRRVPDALPLDTPGMSDSKARVNDASGACDRKANVLGETTKHSDPKAVPRSSSYYQHDDRGTASQDGRRSGHRVTAERGYRKDTKDNEERPNSKIASSEVPEKDRKAVGRGGERDYHAWRHDKFTEVEGDTNPPAKRRRPFREEKIPVQTEPPQNTVPETNKTAHPMSSTAGSERREERGRDGRPFERRELDRGYQRERSFSNRGTIEKAGFPPRERFGGGDSGSRYRGRDNFGGRQGYRPSGNGGRVEKWKHDLFDEANRSPTSKTEEDPIAKVEALLSS